MMHFKTVTFGDKIEAAHALRTINLVAYKGNTPVENEKFHYTYAGKDGYSYEYAINSAMEFGRKCRDRGLKVYIDGTHYFG